MKAVIDRCLHSGSFAPDALLSAMNALPIAVAWASLDGHSTLSANDAFIHLFGYQAGDFSTVQDWVEATFPFREDRAITSEQWGCHFGDAEHSEYSIDPMEVRVRCKNGTVKTILHSGLIAPEQGFAFATFVDITLLKPPEMLDPPPNELAQGGELSSNLPSAHAFAVDEGFRLNSWEESLNVEREREAIRMNAELLDRTGQLAGVGGWAIDLVTGSVSWTAETHRIHGVPLGYRPTLESGIRFYANEARHRVRNIVEDAICTGSGWDVEAPLIRANGQRIWVRTRGIVELAGDKPVRVVGVIQDITSRVNEQTALKQANERLVLATASGLIGTFYWDLLNQGVFWDDRMYRLYGLDPALRNGSYEVWAERVHPEERERAEQVVTEAIASGANYEDEYRVIWPNGAVHHLRAMGQATCDESRRPARISGVVWDVTEQRRIANEKTAQHDELFRVTLESIGDGVITTDAETRVQWMNPVAERLTGWRMEEAAGLPLSDIFHLIHEETRERVESPLAACLEQERATGRAPNTLLISRDGTEIGIDDSAAPIRNSQGEILGVVLVFHDVTEQRRLARESRRVLQLDLQMKDNFLSHVSHELRSPLASIYSFASIIADGLAGDTTAPQNEYLDIILRNSRQLRAMIDDLLQVSQSETGKLTIHLAEASVSEALQDTLNTLSKAAEGGEITLSSQCPPDLPNAYADSTRLRQILIIIVDNAIKFTPAGGSIQVSASTLDGDLLRFCITDTGRGIHPEALDRIFEHLYQANEPGQEGRKGLGLGLFIAQDLVVRQGGRIWVESDLGKGSRFFFTVPIYTELCRALPVNPWGVERRRA